PAWHRVLELGRARPRERHTAAAGVAGDVRSSGDVHVLLPDPPLHEGHGHGSVRRLATLVAVIAGTGAAALAAAPAASAALRQYWVAAVPAPSWNMAPNERDAIMGTQLSPSQTVFPTVVYRRYTTHWHHPMRNDAAGSSHQDL